MGKAWPVDLGSGTHLLHTVEVRISYVPFVTVADLEAPGQLRLIQVHQQSDGEVTELDLFVVKAAAGDSEEGREPWQQLSKVAQTWHSGDEGAVGAIFVGDKEGDP